MHCFYNRTNKTSIFLYKLIIIHICIRITIHLYIKILSNMNKVKAISSIIIPKTMYTIAVLLLSIFAPIFWSITL